MAVFLHCSIVTPTPTDPSTLIGLPTTYIPKFQNQAYWASLNADIEAHLKMAIPIRSPMSVFEPMHNLTFSTPRSMAPALCIAACEVLGGSRQEAIDTASAVHLMQAATYTHENLLFTDQEKPNAIGHSSLYDANIELLTGDALLPFAIELIARSDTPSKNNSQKILRAIIKITRAMGPQGILEGQYNKMQRIGLDCDGSDDAMVIHQACKKAEGELYSCSAACGAILGGGNEDDIKKLRTLGLYVGLMHGLMLRGTRPGKVQRKLLKMVEEIKALALEELNYFKDRNVDTISSLLDVKY